MGKAASALRREFYQDCRDRPWIYLWALFCLTIFALGMTLMLDASVFSGSMMLKSLFPLRSCSAEIQFAISE